MSKCTERQRCESARSAAEALKEAVDESRPLFGGRMLASFTNQDNSWDDIVKTYEDQRYAEDKYN